MAPLEHTVRSPTASFLPPAPTLLDSCACINYEPEITHTGTSDEKSDECEAGEEEGDEGDEDEDEENAIVSLRFGPPKGHSRSGQASVDSRVMYFITILSYLLFFPDNEEDAIVPLHFGLPKGHSHSGQGKDEATSTSVDSKVMYFTTILLYLLVILDINLANLSPLEREPPANGSSCSTGGIICGRALGNAPNIGDPFNDVQDDVKPLFHGQVNVTIVQQPPGDVVVENPTSHLKVMSPCYETLAPILKKVAKSYSPVCSKYSIR